MQKLLHSQTRRECLRQNTFWRRTSFKHSTFDHSSLQKMNRMQAHIFSYWLQRFSASARGRPFLAIKIDKETLIQNQKMMHEEIVGHIGTLLNVGLGFWNQKHAVSISVCLTRLNRNKCSVDSPSMQTRASFKLGI